MPADRLLTTVLRAYQGTPHTEQNNRILGSTTSLLTTLSNPLNITLLTSHLLTAPAIWSQAVGLQTCLRIISIYNTAAITVHGNQFNGHKKPHDAYQPRQGGGIACDEWTTAVIKSLDNRTPRWQHMLVIGGVLLGMEGGERHGLSRGLRTNLENAMVTAANLSFKDPASSGDLGSRAVVLALNHTFPLLSGNVRRELNYDALVMNAVQAMTSAEGYQEGYFLEAIDFDVKEVYGKQFDWSAKSASFLQLQKLGSNPLISSMGPLSRLIAHSIENLNNPRRIIEVREHLLKFTGNILERWRRIKLSEIDVSEESTFLTAETLRVTFPALWQVLKTSMFATVVILRAVLGRTLIDPFLASSHQAPITATHSLQTLSSIHFISSRMGTNVFSAYTFVTTTSMDILSRYPSHTAAFLRYIYPSQAGLIPAHPLQRNHDLFYLNTAEHFTLVLSPTDAESLIVTPCLPYLSPSYPSQLLLREIFETAHSAMLAVFAAPRNEVLTARIIPSYVESLFASFPENLSPRQFRFAFKALIQICTPPNPLSRSQPMMAETLLDMLHYRALTAPSTPLPPAVQSGTEAQGQQELPLSEQAVLLLTLLDALPCITLSALEDWLPMAADLLNFVKDRTMKEHCKARFWEVLEGGEMDVDRSAVCVGWWSTRGGRDRVLFRNEGVGGGEGAFMMSGGLGDGGEKSRL